MCFSGSSKYTRQPFYFVNNLAKNVDEFQKLIHYCILRWLIVRVRTIV